MPDISRRRPFSSEMVHLLKKGEQIPQTVEALREIMARDAELMLEQATTISNQSQIINQLRQKVAKLLDQRRLRIFVFHPLGPEKLAKNDTLCLSHKKLWNSIRRQTSLPASGHREFEADLTRC